MQKVDHPLLPPMVNLDHIEDEIREGTIFEPEPDWGAPSALSPPATYNGCSALQIIAQGIIRLPWREAEKMASGIGAKTKGSMTLAAAIQAWAEEWKTFK